MHLHIGAVTYTVSEAKLRGACGTCNYEQARIRINARLDPQLKRVTLWHEIIHALLFNAGVYTAEHNEQQIDALAHGIIQVLRDNPWLKG
jgi:Zn-dependent peptidase ImmA (M78 family)